MANAYPRADPEGENVPMSPIQQRNKRKVLRNMLGFPHLADRMSGSAK